MQALKTIGGVQMNELAVYSAYHQHVQDRTANDFFMAVGQEQYRQALTGGTLRAITRSITLVNGVPTESFHFNGYMLTRFEPVVVGKGWRARLIAWLLKSQKA
jgi:hypothetical protein